LYHEFEEKTEYKIFSDGIKKIIICIGEMPEWLNGTVSKTVVGFISTQGSNPCLSANLRQPKFLTKAWLLLAGLLAETFVHLVRVIIKINFI
jgi:hypothetical protein